MRHLISNTIATAYISEKLIRRVPVLKNIHQKQSGFRTKKSKFHQYRAHQGNVTNQRKRRTRGLVTSHPLPIL